MRPCTWQQHSGHYRKPCSRCSSQCCCVPVMLTIRQHILYAQLSLLCTKLCQLTVHTNTVNTKPHPNHSLGTKPRLGRKWPVRNGHTAYRVRRNSFLTDFWQFVVLCVIVQCLYGDRRWEWRDLALLWAGGDPSGERVRLPALHKASRQQWRVDAETQQERAGCLEQRDSKQQYKDDEGIVCVCVCGTRRVAQKIISSKCPHPPNTNMWLQLMNHKKRAGRRTRYVWG